ncbi:MAG: glycosyltransferase family 4 protein [Candidatus Paceibacterota bacterium]|jgi:glycosyltransferase involved in cell wall biosynthesis
MRKILIFSLVYYPRYIGGAEIAIKEITDRISTDDVQFDMVTLHLDSSLPKFERIGNVDIYRVGWTGKQKTSSDSLHWYLDLNKYAFLITGFLKAVSLHRKKKYDAIWSLMATYNSFAALFFKLIHPKVPFIFTLQDGDPIPYIKKRARPLYPLFKMIFRRADCIQTISKYLADWAVDMGAKCEVKIVPNGVDYAYFSKQVSSGRLEALKGQLGKQKDDIFIITTSRLVVKNAVNDIIDSLQYLPENVKLLILGSGYEESRLKAMSEVVPEAYPAEGGPTLGSRVQFLGNIPHDQLPKYLQVSDIFVRPSLSEGFGNSFIEAMAAGIPVIATPVGGIVDFLQNGETGLFCEVKNPKSIAQKVEKLMKDKESREYIIRQASEMVRQKYDWDMVAEKMNEIFENM